MVAEVGGSLGNGLYVRRLHTGLGRRGGPSLIVGVGPAGVTDRSYVDERSLGVSTIVGAAGRGHHSERQDHRQEAE